MTDREHPQGHDQQSYYPQGHDQQSYDQQSYYPQGHDQQSYDQQSYDQQSYDQQSYDQQGHDQQGYQQRLDIRSVNQDKRAREKQISQRASKRHREKRTRETLDLKEELNNLRRQVETLSQENSRLLMENYELRTKLYGTDTSQVNSGRPRQDKALNYYEWQPQQQQQNLNPLGNTVPKNNSYFDPVYSEQDRQ